MSDSKIERQIFRRFEIILEKIRIVPLIRIKRGFIDCLHEAQGVVIQKVGKTRKRPGSFRVAAEPGEQFITASVHTKLQRMTVGHIRRDILELVQLFDPALRKDAETANREEIVDTNRRTFRVIFRKAETASNVSQSSFIQESIAEDARVTDRVILPPYGLSGDRKSTRLNSSHIQKSRMPSSA